MSVNFYARATGSPTIGPALAAALTADPEGLHVGQARAHCDFLMRAHPELGLTTMAAWRDLLAQPGITLWAESGYQISVQELLEEITDPRFRRFGWRTPDFRDDGVAFTAAAFQ
ncbi:hypothetical protein HD597_000454 [Nonomuraea thailandensis]|uniref:Uncharacterized protein n=1 Tax=Nonomuraea thailandensis TaxID=1188745 RepID=A0A9X2G9U2_9ACTN|nr:hypothetical protein [Nonomuraea thailandensis]MCP2353434.1 hypothetical protein [Nonomuraea thailandensis]